MDRKKRSRLVKALMTELTKVVKVHPDVTIHSEQHWQKVAEVAGELATLAGEPDNLIRAAIVAGLLHDIGRVADSTQRDPDHGDRSARIAREKGLLNLLGVEKALHEGVYFAIANHTRGKRTDQPVAKYLWDADRLCLVHFNRRIVDPDLMSTTVWSRLCN